MRQILLTICLSCALWRGIPTVAAEPTAGQDLFAKENLIAWCIVPFDSKKRGPEERAAMLEKLGFSKFAYDYRSEHIPTFDAELEALKRHHVELTAWWFPTSLNDEAKLTLQLFERHRVTPQLWVTGGGAPTKSADEQQQRVRDEAARIRPIAEAAAKVGCKVALYNHGGWFGEPENQLAIIQELGLPNVGIVYNLHHGHDHLDRFPELLSRMLPHLYALNLNGMVKDGERRGQKILQLGQGDLDLSLLQTIRRGGYRGPIGILGHTADDAEERLQDNLDGLHWLLPQLDGKPAAPKPKTRTPIPVAQAAVNAKPVVEKIPRLIEGKFGKAMDGRAGGAFVAGREEFHQFPLTVECWTKLTNREPYNILVAHELKSSGTHWELFSMAGTGNLAAYTPGFTPDHCHSQAMICDGKWHQVGMVIEANRIRLYADGKLVADQACQRNSTKSVPGDLAIGTLVDQQIGCTGLIDEVRLSRGVRSFGAVSEKTFVVDESTIGLWHFDELVEQKQYDDATRLNPALIASGSIASADGAKRGKLEGHWGEDALGFRWTEEDSRDDRFGQMDTGPFFCGSITGAGGTDYKGIVVRVGPNRTDSILYDTELMRASAGWHGFVRFDAARFGIIVPPRIEGDVAFSTPLLGGWTRSDQFSTFRTNSKFGGLPKNEAHYEGLYRHGQRVVLKFAIGDAGLTASDQGGVAQRTLVWESPWLEQVNGASALTRTLLIEPSATPLSLLVAEQSSRVRLIGAGSGASLIEGPEKCHVLRVPPHEKSITLKLLIASAKVDPVAMENLVALSPPAEDLMALVKPGPAIWGDPLVTVGEVSNIRAPLVIDTITLPFDNPFKALMFCGGHDFLPDGRAVVCTLHGDVWLVDGIDETLQRITWKRFATGLFQPLGIKWVPKAKREQGSGSDLDLYVVGRDQITRLHDQNGDGEADVYENFNNDAYVSLNGHEYVTCLETDREGNFYYIKGNCDSQTPHDGALLRVTPDGRQLEIIATGFRNSDGIGIGPNGEITVAPQEGEWTPASALFDVRRDGFYGYMRSNHQNPAPTDFERPICWFPRLADNSSGGQVWVPPGHWGPLANQLLLLSYGQCELRLILREPLPVDGKNGSVATGGAFASAQIARRSPLVSVNGGSTEFPLTFASGIHRGRFNPRDGHLYLTGLKGWVTSAVNDGCFQRVRYLEQPNDVLIGMKTYHNGIALTFTGRLKPDEASNIDNYQLEAWNYHWSSTYGSPDLRPSAPGQIGRDLIEPKSVTLLEDGRTVFIEIPDLKPVDQLGVGYSLHGIGGEVIEQTAYLTLNGIPNEAMPESQLRRSQSDVARADLLARLSPGVIITAPFLTGPVKARMLAWADFESPTAGQQITANGYLKVPATGEYRLRTSTSANAVLEIDGASMSVGEQGSVFKLKKGFHRLRVIQGVTQPKSTFRLLWESERFPLEAIPASFLFHESDSTLDSDSLRLFAEGRDLYLERRCGQCHQSAATVAGSMSATISDLRQAPLLDRIGQRLTRTWLMNWLGQPGHLRPDASMPSLVGSQSRTAQADLIAYLLTLGDVGDGALPAEPSAADELGKEKGEVLFERLGCISCHTFAAADPTPEWNRISLYFVAAKFQPGQLEAFLKNPQRHHVGSRMPQFHLDDQEVRSLAAHLRDKSKGTFEPLDAALSGDPDRGKKLFADLRCQSCHQIVATDKLATAQLPSILKADLQAGCLSSEVAPGHKSPVFQWSEHQRAAIRAYVTAIRQSSAPIAIRQENPLPKLLSALRCNACHTRDGSSARWPEVVAEEGSGKIPDLVPQLTWVGEKIQGPWIAAFLKGEIKQKPRPWIAARMPSFPDYADLIAHSMAQEHGVAFSEPRPTLLDARLVEIGQRLTQRDGGLDCRQCHGVGKDRPKGDTATQIALGINFAMTRDRLRPEFAMRQLLDPPRYDMGSRMPRFAVDLKTTAAKQLEGGDAKKQFEAAKQFIWSLNPEE